MTFESLLTCGKALLAQNPEAGRTLRASVRADDLATIIYTSGTTGTPKGVMLSHENMSSNVMAAFTGLPDLRRGQEVAVSFLPLTHVFARTLHYGFLAWGMAVYFTTPERLRDHLKEVKPTMFATVPRVLERVFEGILKAGADLSGVQKPIFDWAVALARRFEPGKDGGPVYSTQRRAAAKLVFDRWQGAMGGRLKLVIAGGAAVRPELVRVFGAAGVSVLQGYGLTETGPVIAFNRPGSNRPGTVGELLPGTEAKLTKQGELLARGPQVMLGYYNNPEATAGAVDADGWFHTGDLAEITDGFVTITGRLKNLFKLSTGKYVTPQPLEAALEARRRGHDPRPEIMVPLVATVAELDITRQELTRVIAQVLREAGLVQTRNQGVTHVNALCRASLDAAFPGLLDAVVGAEVRGAGGPGAVPGHRPHMLG